MNKDSQDAHANDWLTISEACKYLEISEQTMFRWMRSGKITYYKVGKSTRFKVEDLDATVERIASKTSPADDLNICSLCGSTELIKGNLSSLGELVFKPEDSRFSVWKNSAIEVKAMCCKRCGNITLKGNIADLSQ